MLQIDYSVDFQFIWTEKQLNIELPDGDLNQPKGESVTLASPVPHLFGLSYLSGQFNDTSSLLPHR